MASEERDDSMRVGTAFLQGACAGAFLALLFAPRTGREFRDELRKQAQQGREKIQKWADEGRETVTDAVDNAVDKGKEVAHDAQRKITAFKNENRNDNRQGVENV